MRQFTLAIAIVLVNIAHAQCDSSSVRQWLRSINYDTVCTTQPDPQHYQSRIKFKDDSSSFSYHYLDTLTGESTYKYYQNYWLLRSEQWSGSMDSIITTFYYEGRCTVQSIITEYINDSLSNSDEGGKYYDYYSRILFNEKGRKASATYITHEVVDGTKMKKIVTIDYKGIFSKKKTEYRPEK